MSLSAVLAEDKCWRGPLPSFHDFGPVEDEALREEEPREEEAPLLWSRRLLKSTLREPLLVSRAARREWLRRRVTEGEEEVIGRVNSRRRQRSGRVR